MIRTSPLSYQQLTKLFGVTRPRVKAVLYNQFHVPADYVPTLRYYQLKEMTGHQFDSYRTADGLLRSGRVDIPEQFLIIYQDCNPAEVRKSQTVRCSFRIADTSFNIEPICIVRIVKENYHV